MLVLLAGLLWGTTGLFAKAPHFDSWPAVVDGWPVRGLLLAFWRTLFASIVLFPLVRRPNWNAKLIPSSLIFTAMNVTFLAAITNTTDANAIWLQHTAPAWVFLIGVFCFGESVHPRDWLLVGFALLGVSFIVCFETSASFEVAGQSRLGVVYGLFSGLTYAGVVLSLRWMRDQEAAWVVAVNHLATAVILLPFVVYQNRWPTGEQFIVLAGYGIVQLGLPYWLFARGVQGIAGHEASGIVLIEPLLVPLWVYLAWHNEPSYVAPRWWSFVGGGLILIGLLCRYLGLRRQSKSAATNESSS